MKQVLTTLLLAFSLGTCLAQTPCSLDPGWDGDGKMVADGSRMGEHIVVQPDGKVLVACNPFGDSYAYIKRYNTDGTVDNGFGTSGSFTVQVAERRTDIDGMVLHNGTIYICGSTTTDIGGTNTYCYAAAIQGNGGYVNTFGVAGVKKFNSGMTDFYTSSDIDVDANGKVYVTGLEWMDNLFVCRLTSTGALDASWDGDGVAFVPTGLTNHWFEVNDMAIDTDGKVVITGKKYKANNGSTIPAFWNLLVMRFTASGGLDNTFATGGIGLYNSQPTNFDEGKVICPTPDEGYMLIGNAYDNVDYDYTAMKLQGNGVIDGSFGNQGWSVNDLEMNNEMEYLLNGALMPDGRVLLTGNQGSGDTVHFSLLMLTAGGQRDNSFAPNGLFRNIFNQNNNSSSSGLDVTPDGKIYLGGYTRTCANGTCGPMYMALSRYFGATPMVAVEVPMVQGLLMYPNPIGVGQELRFNGLEGMPEVVELMDLQGRVVSLPAVDGYRIPSLAAGVYLCRVQVQGQTTVAQLRVY